MLKIIVATLFISLISNLILKRYHLPTIIGYILTGTIIAYGFGLHSAIHNHDLKEIAEFGVVFLMFTIGLEFSIEHLKKMKHEVFVAGTLQIMVTTLIVYGLNYYIFGFEQKVSLIIALAISLSSTAIVLKTFNETGEINRRHGRRSLGILIMQDIAVIPILLIIGFMSKDTGDIGTVLFNMSLSAIILLFLLWFIGRFLLDPFFDQITKTNSDELFVSTILFLAIGASYLAHFLGFSYSLGAFIAGMLIAETRYKHKVEAELIPFRDILLGIFFITVGMQIDFAIIVKYIHIIVLLLVGIMLLKFSIIYAIIRFKENKKVSIQTALSLLQIGEFSLAILELARTNSLIGPPHGQIMIVTIVLSMIATPFILKNLTALTDKLTNKESHADIGVAGLDTELLENHTVIIGFGDFGKRVASIFKGNGELYVAIEGNIENFNKAYKDKQPIIFGDGAKREILNHANIKDAKSVIIAVNNREHLYHICSTIKRFVSNDKIIVKVQTQKDKEIIHDLGIEHILVANELTSNAFFELVHNQLSYPTINWDLKL
ncbi:MAG: cation:proton antiporter [Campylobacterota bacterium]|nr:cation:proton antiporter [Campylobacterota bacterium]